jgi:hypothetical protein
MIAGDFVHFCSPSISAGSLSSGMVELRLQKFGSWWKPSQAEKARCRISPPPGIG